jgi:hypothetical protein
MSPLPTPHTRAAYGNVPPARITRPASHDTTASADDDPTRPPTATSTQRLVVSIFAVEAVYTLALATAVPHGTVAVGIAIAMTCLLAILIKTRMDVAG